MGSYKWGSKSPKKIITLVTLLITPLKTTHEPPSRIWGFKAWQASWSSGSGL